MPWYVGRAQIVDDILAPEGRESDGLNGFVLLLHLGSQRQDRWHPHVPRLPAEPGGARLHVRGWTKGSPSRTRTLPR